MGSEIKFTDLPSTDNYTEEDSTVIDDGKNTKRISISVLVQKITQKVKELVNKYVDGVLELFKSDINTKIKEQNEKVDNQISTLNADVNNALEAQTTAVNNIVNDLKQDVANQLEANSLPFFVDKNGRLLIRVKEEENA